MPEARGPQAQGLRAYIPYSGKVWQGESLANRLRFAKLKPSKLIVTIDNPMADLVICQTFFCQTFENSRFGKHSARQTFPLYGIRQITDGHVISIMYHFVPTVTTPVVLIPQVIVTLVHKVISTNC